MTAPSSDETGRRRDLAQRVVQSLAGGTALRASLLTGSVALGIADQRSDIDLLNYYDELPERTTFDALMSGLGATLTRELSPPGAPEFLSSYAMEAIEVQTGAQLAASMEATLEQIAGGEVNWAAAKVAMGLQEGVALYGEETIAGWKERISYPDDLRRREIEANLAIFPIWSADAQLRDRDAELFRRQMLVEGAFRVVAALSALNGLYFSTFQFKRAGAHIAHMRLKPERLSERLDRVAGGEPRAAAAELEQVVTETRDLIRNELPGVDVAPPWRPGA